MARLFGAEDIARPANLQIPQGNAKTGAELRILLDGLESSARQRRDAARSRQQHIGIGTVLVTTDPAAKLVQLGQSEPIRIGDEDGIGIGNIDAGLNDR